MRKIGVLVGLIMMMTLLNVINAQHKKRYAESLSGSQLLDVLLEAKRRGLLHKSEAVEKEQTRRHKSSRLHDEDNQRLLHTLRKAVGLSDDPYKRTL